MTKNEQSKKKRMNETKELTNEEQVNSKIRKDSHERKGKGIK